jgi:hypothetical protein
MKCEYQEGTKAAAAFEQLGRALFQAPKTVLTKPKKAVKKKSARRKKEA